MMRVRKQWPIPAVVSSPAFMSVIDPAVVFPAPPAPTQDLNAKHEGPRGRLFHIVDHDGCVSSWAFTGVPPIQSKKKTGDLDEPKW